MPLVVLAAIAVAVWVLLRGSRSDPAASGAGQGLSSSPAAPPSYQVATQQDYETDQGPDFGAGSEPGLLSRIVQAVIQAESGGRQTDANGNTLRSKAGALGLMQLMPATAAQYGVDPNDAAQNVQGGTAYLSDLFQQYGNWYDALAAYNWGPGNVNRAMASGANFPPAVANYASGILNNVQGDS
jgi:soluble lytic murein transglycosylase-like protein